MPPLSGTLLHRLCLVLLPDNKGQVVPSYGGSAFEAEARERFPEIDLIDSDGALHLVMSQLAEAGREAIEAGDLPFLRRLFAFVTSAAERPDAAGEIENALAISFLEPGDFAGSHGPETLNLLPGRLRTLIHEAV